MREYTMTWGEFKRQTDQQVKDDDVVYWIVVNGYDATIRTKQYHEGMSILSTKKRIGEGS